jgi:hypothetical protein
MFYKLDKIFYQKKKLDKIHHFVLSYNFISETSNMLRTTNLHNNDIIICKSTMISYEFFKNSLVVKLTEYFFLTQTH